MLEWIKENKTWIFSGVGIAITTLFLTTFLDQKTSSPAQTQSGTGNIQAGRDVSIVTPPPEIREGDLDIVEVRFTDDSEFDVKVRNIGDIDLIINRISVTKLDDSGIGVSPILEPSAEYHIPVDDIAVGNTKSIDVSHVVHAHSADRFLIALETTNVYLLRVTLHYDKGRITFFEKQTW